MRETLAAANYFVADTRGGGEKFYEYTAELLAQYTPVRALKNVVAVSYGAVFSFSIFIYDHGQEVWDHWNVTRDELLVMPASFAGTWQLRVAAFLRKQRRRCFYCTGRVRDPEGMVHLVERVMTATVCGEPLPYRTSDPRWARYEPTEVAVTCVLCLSS